MTKKYVLKILGFLKELSEQPYSADDRQFPLLSPAHRRKAHDKAYNAEHGAYKAESDKTANGIDKHQQKALVAVKPDKI